MRKFLPLLLLLLIGLPAAHAQISDHQVIYINDAAEVIALNPATGEQRVLVNVSSPFSASFGLHPSPDGSKLAVFANYWDPNASAAGMLGIKDLHLYIVSLGDGQLLYEQSLLSPGFVDPGIALGDPVFEMTRAVGEIVWSPDSRYLAFISGQNPTADVYLYDASDNSVRNLESGQFTAAFLRWNPTGTILLYSEIESFGSGGGIEVVMVNQVRLPEGSLQPIALPETATASGISIVGWLNDTTLLYSPLSFLAGGRGLYAMDLSSGTATPLIDETAEITVPVYDVTSQSAAFIVPDLGLETSLQPGIYLWQNSTGQTAQVQAGSFYFVEAASPNTFKVAGPDGTYLLNSQVNSLTLLPPSDYGTFISPVADLVALYRGDGVYASQISADNASLVWNGDAQIPVWSPDGTVFYTFGITDQGAGLVRVDLANRTYTVLDSRMAVSSPIAVTP